MDEFEYEEKFKPDFNADINSRLKKLQLEIVFLADTRYRSYFDSRKADFKENDYTHIVWTLIHIATSTADKKSIAIFGFRENHNLPYEIRIFFYEKVFLKHFPGSDGQRVSKIY